MKIYFYHKQKALLIFGLVILLTAVCFLGFFEWPQPVQGAVNRILPIYNVDTKDKEIALTFDVAWGDSDFEQILGILEKHSAKATFFCTGEWVEKYPQHVKTAKERGHDVQNHSHKHPHVASIPTEDLKEDTEACRRAIESVLGYSAMLYRAPYGEYSNSMMTALQDAGYLVIQWDVDSRDWQETATVEKITSSVLKNTKEGSILLFHVDAKQKCTPQALENILSQLSQEGYQFILVQDLLIDGEYTIDANGTMRKKQ